MPLLLMSDWQGLLAVADETVYENLEEGNEWVANDEEDPDNWLEEKIEEGNEENANEVPNIVLW